MERAPESMRAAEIAAHRLCPGIITRSLSGKYNCYGMVFASRRVVIEHPEDVEQILRDDGYNRVHQNDVKIGDVIIYRKAPNEEVQHVGLIVEVGRNIEAARIDLMILSQFGFDGEYFHPEHLVPPQYGTHRDYYTERGRR